MAVREYVGARYVPLFSTPLEWSNTREYEPLTIVLNEGNSYTSRQFVPLGIDISNETYWALTGNYDAQVEKYRQEVQAFDGRITTNTNNIATLTAKSKAAVQDILIFGDSWFEGEGVRGSKTITASLVSLTNANVYQYAMGGAKFTTHDGNPGLNGSVDAQIAKCIADKAFDFSTVKYIILGGGVNDYGRSVDSNTFSSAVITMINTLKGSFPNAAICWISNFQILPSADYLRWYNSVAYSLNNYALSYSLVNCLNYSLYNTNDWIHPNQNGYIVGGKYVYDLLNGGAMYRPFNMINLSVTKDNMNILLRLQTEECNAKMHIYGTLQLQSFPEQSGYANLTTVSINRDLTVTATNDWSAKLSSGSTYLGMVPDAVGNLTFIDTSNGQNNMLLGITSHMNTHAVESFDISFNRYAGPALTTNTSIINKMSLNTFL